MGLRRLGLKSSSGLVVYNALESVGPLKLLEFLKYLLAQEILSKFTTYTKYLAFLMPQWELEVWHSVLVKSSSWLDVYNILRSAANLEALWTLNAFIAADGHRISHHVS